MSARAAANRCDPLGCCPVTRPVMPTHETRSGPSAPRRAEGGSRTVPERDEGEATQTLSLLLPHVGGRLTFSISGGAQRRPLHAVVSRRPQH
jgi:hypothetical protein